MLACTTIIHSRSRSQVLLLLGQAQVPPFSILLLEVRELPPSSSEMGQIPVLMYRLPISSSLRAIRRQATLLSSYRSVSGHTLTVCASKISIGACTSTIRH